MEKIQKLTDLMIDAALDFTREYQKKATAWAKIEAAACYVKGVHLVRRQCLFLALQFFGLILLSISVIFFPIFLLYFAPFSAPTKLMIVAGLGVIYIGAPLLFFFRLFSEKRWLEFSKTNEIIDKVTSQN